MQHPCAVGVSSLKNVPVIAKLWKDPDLPTTLTFIVWILPLNDDILPYDVCILLPVIFPAAVIYPVVVMLP